MPTKKRTLTQLKEKMDIHKRKSTEDYLRAPYTRLITPDEEGGFSAEILEFPGCFAQGETSTEAFENLEKTAQSWIEVELDQGREIPSPSVSAGYNGKIALRLPKDLHRLAVRKAERDGVSLNQCLVAAVATWLGADNLYSRLVEQLNRPSLQIVAQVNNFQSIAGTGNKVTQLPQTPQGFTEVETLNG